MKSISYLPKFNMRYTIIKLITCTLLVNFQNLDFKTALYKFDKNKNINLVSVSVSKKLQNLWSLVIFKQNYH